ncbi:hypothetical protein ACPUD8_00610 [Brevibacterium sp. FAM 25378]|uniref:hypothetical protein n=1 Tax=unclassified Brevibacterium TaxID=2614124 RepID=UPI0010925907|nr:hypothetical protein [Brevibacterium sp. S22]TGD33213.1 hypothetical protein EB835_01550 [Brevibacterium sp. S22]
MSDDLHTDAEANLPSDAFVEVTAPGEDSAAEAAPTSAETLRVPSVEGRSQVRADDGEPISDEMASSAAVAAVVAIRQVAIAYAAQQAAAADESEIRKGDRAGFRAPRRNVRKRLPQTWDQHLGR